MHCYFDIQAHHHIIGINYQNKYMALKHRLNFKHNIGLFMLLFAAVGGYILIHSLAASNPNLPGDLNNDNTVNVTDLSILLSNYGTTNSTADINTDGQVNVLDLSILLSNYGKSYVPVGVQPPAAPTAYSLPASYTAVNSTASLLSAINSPSFDIVMENGDYTNAGSVNIGVHRLWARNLGGAVLHFGLQLGGNASGSGAQVHGIKFDLTDPATAFQGAIINIWGAAGANSVIADSWFYGHNALDSGILARTTSGFNVQRVVVNGFQSYGIFFETYYPDYWTDSPSPVPIVSDADISAVYRPTRSSANGTAEAGLWAGTNSQVSRIKIRNTGWMGLWLGGNANNGTYSDFDIDQIYPTSIGVYLEHYARNNTFKNFVIGSASNTGVQVGYNCEWADPAYAGTNPVSGQSIGACHGNIIQDGTLYTTYRGVQLEDAENTTIQRIKFVGQTNAAIDDFMTSGTGYSTTWQNLGNDFSGLAAGAVQYTQAH